MADSARAKHTGVPLLVEFASNFILMPSKSDIRMIRSQTDGPTVTVSVQWELLSESAYLCSKLVCVFVNSPRIGDILISYTERLAADCQLHQS